MTTSSGIISNVQELLRTSIATCTAFQEWLSTDSPMTLAEAKARIYHDKIPDPAAGEAEYDADELAWYVPFCVIATDPIFGFTMEWDGSSGQPQYAGRGRFIADFWRKVDLDDDDRHVEFRNWMGALITSGNVSNPGLLELSGKAGYLQISKLSVLGPQEHRPEYNPQIGELSVMTLVIEWQ